MKKQVMVGILCLFCAMAFPQLTASARVCLPERQASVQTISAQADFSQEESREADVLLRLWLGFLGSVGLCTGGMVLYAEKQEL